MTDKGQTASFAAQRSRTDSQKAGLRGLENLRLEAADQPFVLLATVVVDRFDQVMTQMLRTVEVRDPARPQLGRQRKFGARHQPMRKMIALGVEHQAVGGDALQ